MKFLSDILTLINADNAAKYAEIAIENIAYDSRRVSAGSLFICIAGATVDGHDYAEAAVQSGAVAVVAERELSVSVPTIVVADCRAVMRAIVPYFYDYPASKMKLIGVTGTNGKTTTTNIIYNILCAAGYKAGLIGTIEARYLDKCIVSKNTTPDVVDLQLLMLDMYEAGVEYLVMEVSSHALAQERVAGCTFDAAVLTNITQDHLDYHKTFDNYVQAKGLLFAGLTAGGKPNTLSVVNVDDPSAAYIQGVSTAVSNMTYSLHGQADIFPLAYKLNMDSMDIRLQTPAGVLECLVETTGLFNIYNIMAAVSVALHFGVDLATIKNTLTKFHPVAGRFELVKCGQPFSVIVDYAHTPDGLENVLKTAKDITQGRLIAVFGCGGNRDKTKRPIMAGIAEQLADVVVITSDNPRKEDPAAILSDVEAGVQFKDTTDYITIEDRTAAIRHALTIARANDTVLIAGKGHETYQILFDRTIDFDDRLVAKNILMEIGYADN